MYLLVTESTSPRTHLKQKKQRKLQITAYQAQRITSRACKQEQRYRLGLSDITGNFTRIASSHVT
jgi:hypothetical protein